MFSVEDTIVAIATPPGRGSIGIVRLSGPDASGIAARIMRRRAPLEARRATFGRAFASDGPPASTPGAAIDQVVATRFPAPHSYTGDEVVELALHGSQVLLRKVLCETMNMGARLARPGEFTLRAFLNGRMDLVQAEAVADLIDAATPAQAHAAFDQLDGTLTTRIGEIDRALFDVIARLEASLDFPDEGYHFVDPAGAAGEIGQALDPLEQLLRAGARGRLLREGLSAAIVGTPNVGKSTLFNHLVGSARAIVTSTPGTTRDLLTERVDVGGVPITLVDTAGVRDSQEEIEAEGVARAHGALAVADLAIVVLDRSRSLEPDDRDLLARTRERPALVVINKRDLPAAWRVQSLPVRDHVIEISLRAPDGAARLTGAIAAAIGDDAPLGDAPPVTNVRHLRLLELAAEALRRARAAAAQGIAEEFVLADLHGARAHLEEITGRRASDAVLSEIFQRFCIGK